MSSEERLPPFDVDAEEAVIGSLLLDSEAIIKVISVLTPDDFYREKNRWVYEACSSLYQRNEAINQVGVAQELSRVGKLEGVGGVVSLGQSVAMVPTPLHVEHYAQIVQRLGVMRRLIVAGGQIAGIGYGADPDAEASLSKAEDILFKLRYGRRRRDFVHIREVLDKYFEELEQQTVPGAEGKRAVRTHFNKLDEYLGELQPSDFVVLAARPSMGKTSLALNIARNAAVYDKACVAVFSLEMSRESLVQRLISNESGVDSRKMRLGLQNEAEERRVMDATGVLSDAHIYIDDSPQLRLMEMRSKARRLHFERGVDLIILDYLQLMQSDIRTENRVQEVSEITRALKGLARDLNIPLIAVSQLSRAPDIRSEHRPQLPDLRESGSIEQDADVVLFIYRDDYYYDQESWEKTFPDKDYPRGIAEVIIAKHRNGPTGQINLRFEPRIAKFGNLEEAA
ncbi:MAG: dnaB [Dehalococcoidia bacterium]|nr:dnaB [Dehalococcoidia bacterium]